MTSPLEYLLLMMMTAQPDASAPGIMSKLEPASGAPQAQSVFVQEDGKLNMRTILMEPRDMMTEKLEAPVKIPPEWLPSFKVGTPLTITIDETMKTYQAKIVRIESITDETGSTVQVIAALDRRPEELQPGMVGTAIVASVP